MSDDKPSLTSLILTPGDNGAERIQETNRLFKRLLEDHRPEGVGYIVIAFETPLSLRRPQVALASDHDVATLERILSGILHRDKPRVIA